MQCIKDHPYSLNCNEETVITDYYMNWLLNIFCTFWTCGSTEKKQLSDCQHFSACNIIKQKQKPRCDPVTVRFYFYGLPLILAF